MVNKYLNRWQLARGRIGDASAVVVHYDMQIHHKRSAAVRRYEHIRIETI